MIKGGFFVEELKARMRQSISNFDSFGTYRMMKEVMIIEVKYSDGPQGRRFAGFEGFINLVFLFAAADVLAMRPSLPLHFLHLPKSSLRGSSIPRGTTTQSPLTISEF